MTQFGEMLLWWLGSQFRGLNLFLCLVHPTLLQFGRNQKTLNMIHLVHTS